MLLKINYIFHHGLICITLVAHDIEHIFVYLFAVCVSSLVKSPFINIYI